MRKISLSLLLLINVLTKAQEFTVSGSVYDENQKPLKGASISVIDTKIGVITNHFGEFKLKLESGEYFFQVSFVGYENQRIKITVNKNNISKINISLSPSLTLLDEVLVSAVRATPNIPVTYSNLSKKEIAKRNLGQDIPILLNYLPSVISSSDAGAGIGYTYLNIRGSNSERINVTINGIPYNDPESHGTFWVNLGDFASSTENLQIQRGVGTSTNGSGAFGASLNILTDAISEKPGGELSNSLGSFGSRKHTIKFTTGTIDEHFEVSGRFSKIYSDGYVDRAFTDLKSYFIQASYTDKNTLIKSIIFGGAERTYQSWFGLDPQQLEEDRRQNPYTYKNEVDDYQQNHYQFHWNEKLSRNWSTNLGLNYTKGGGFFEQYKADEAASDFNNLIEDRSDVIVRRWLDNHFYVLNFNTNYTDDTLNMIAGVSYSNYIGDHFGEVIWGNAISKGTNPEDRYYFSDAKKTDFSIFSKITYRINEKVSAYLDLQGRFINYQTAGLSSNRSPLNVDAKFNFFNPKAGFVYKIANNNSLYFSYSRGNREANRNDFENGISSPETLDDIEFGWRYKSNNIFLNANLYLMNYKNQLVLTGAIDDVGAPIRATSGRSYRLGMEIDASIVLTKQLSIKPNAALSINKNQDFMASVDGVLQRLGDTNLSFSPNAIVGNTFTYQITENLQGSFLSKFVGRQYMSNLNSKVSNLDVLKSYFVNDLNFVYQINTQKVFDAILITGLVNNIFNTEYVDRGYYYTYDDTWSNPGLVITADGAGYYPQATVNFLVGVTVKF